VKLERSADRLREVWDQRARLDAQYYIKSDLDDQSRESFLDSGLQDVERFVDPWVGQLPATRRALDVGCGVGRLTRAMAGRFDQVVGVDISSAMIKGAWELEPAAPSNVAFEKVCGDGLLPFDDHSFDFVFSYIVFQHLPRLEMVERYLAEFGRILVPGGIARVQLNTHRRSLAERVKIGFVGSEKVPLFHRKLKVRLDPHSFMGVVLSEGQCRGVAQSAGLDLLGLGPLGEQYTWVTLRSNG